MKNVLMLAVITSMLFVGLQQADAQDGIHTVTENPLLLRKRVTIQGGGVGQDDGDLVPGNVGDAALRIARIVEYIDGLNHGGFNNDDNPIGPGGLDDPTGLGFDFDVEVVNGVEEWTWTYTFETDNDFPGLTDDDIDLYPGLDEDGQLDWPDPEVDGGGVGGAPLID
jgi:hypothetical protein